MERKAVVNDATEGKLPEPKVTKFDMIDSFIEV
jgi:hypothetical protein